MNHMMIDIETCGQRANAPVLSIGAVMFDPSTGKMGAEFYVAISPVDAFRYGVPDGDTFKWWMDQADPARKAATAGQKTLAEGLSELTKFGRSDWKDMQVWGNGPSFDMTILEYAYHKALGQLAPWKFWNVRCCRTIALLAGRRPPKIETSVGVYHNALDDARHQAMWVSSMWREIKGRKAAPVIEAQTQTGTLLDL